MNTNITYIHGKTISNPSQQFDNITQNPTQSATGGGIQLIDKDSESCDESIKVDIHTTQTDLSNCYSVGILVNLIP